MTCCVPLAGVAAYTDCVEDSLSPLAVLCTVTGPHCAPSWPLLSRRKSYSSCMTCATSLRVPCECLFVTVDGSGACVFFSACALSGMSTPLCPRVWTPDAGRQLLAMEEMVLDYEHQSMMTEALFGIAPVSMAKREVCWTVFFCLASPRPRPFDSLTPCHCCRPHEPVSPGLHHSYRATTTASFGPRCERCCQT